MDNKEKVTGKTDDITDAIESILEAKIVPLHDQIIQLQNQNNTLIEKVECISGYCKIMEDSKPYRYAKSLERLKRRNQNDKR